MKTMDAMVIKGHSAVLREMDGVLADTFDAHYISRVRTLADHNIPLSRERITRSQNVPG